MIDEITDDTYLQALCEAGAKVVDRDIELLRANDPQKKEVLFIYPGAQSLLYRDVKQAFLDTTSKNPSIVNAFNALTKDRQVNLVQRALQKIIRDRPKVFFSQGAASPG
ncbi:MAG: hypothetical protein AAF569_06445 [Pseudomonadota bacterium]